MGKPGTGIKELLLYFLKLGATGFGGPVALVEYMEDDLVERRGWFSKEEYLQGLAFSKLCPGPMATQLATYLGYVHSGILGASVAVVAFLLPSFVMVLALASAYVQYGGLRWVQASFYGIGAAVIAIMVRSAYKLSVRAFGTKKLLWTLFGFMAVATAFTGGESALFFVLCGLISWFAYEPPAWLAKLRAWSWVPMLGLLAPQGKTPLARSALLGLFIFFLKSSVFVFGSGLAVIPFLYGGVVKDFHWLTDRQFLDAVAVSMITPGPMLIACGFIGYLVGGLVGALLGALGIFLPVYLFVVLLTPWYLRHSGDRKLFAFVQGVTAGAMGALTGAIWILARNSIHDVPTAAIALASFVALVGLNMPEPVLVLASGIAGVIFFRG